MGNPMNRSRSTSFSFLFNHFFISHSLPTGYFLPADPFAQTGGGEEQKSTAGLNFRLAAQTPIRAHQNSGTSNLIRPKVPILSDVISATGGVNISQFPRSFRLSRQPKYP
jgi:hypothetical protein